MYYFTEYFYLHKAAKFTVLFHGVYILEFHPNMGVNSERSVPRDVKNLSVVRVPDTTAACENYAYLSPDHYRDWLRDLPACNRGVLSIGISGRVYQAFPNARIRAGEIALNKIQREECRVNVGDTVRVEYIPVLPQRSVCRVVVRATVLSSNRHAIPDTDLIDERVAEVLNGRFIARNGKFVVIVDVVTIIAEIIAMDHATNNNVPNTCRDDIDGAFVCGETEMWVFRE